MKTIEHLIILIVLIGLLVLIALCIYDKDELLAKVRTAVRSKAMWVNALFATTMQEGPDALHYFAEQFPALQDYLPQNAFQFGMVMLLVANMLIHFHRAKPPEAK